MALLNGNNPYSSEFRITCGTRQGSIISPKLFNIFINDLLVEIKHTDVDFRIESEIINSLDYADDVTRMATMVCGLQRLIDIRNDYAKLWRFNFGQHKSKRPKVDI